MQVWCSLAITLVLGTRDRRFESCHLHHKKKMVVNYNLPLSLWQMMIMQVNILLLLEEFLELNPGVVFNGSTRALGACREGSNPSTWTIFVK
jgi:hypothetical protein